MYDHFIKDPNRYNNSKNSLKRPFSICIVDEASQCVEPEALLPLKLGFTKMIMVGDPEQLPATVTSLTAKNNRFDTSMFTRLFRFFEDTTTAVLHTGGKSSGNSGNNNKYNSPVQRLVYQYRMHSEIIKWPNSYFYGNLLCNGSISRTSTLKPYVVSNFEYFLMTIILIKPFLIPPGKNMKNNLPRPSRFKMCQNYMLYLQLFNLNETKECQTNNDNSLWNDEEAKFVASLAQAICSKLAVENYNSSNSSSNSYTQPPKTCGIITFYQKQRSTICLELQKLGVKVEDDSPYNRRNRKYDDSDKSGQVVSVKTVDGFQVRRLLDTSMLFHINNVLL